MTPSASHGLPGLPYIAVPNPKRRVLGVSTLYVVGHAMVAAALLGWLGWGTHQPSLAWSGAAGTAVAALVLAFGLRRTRYKGTLVIDRTGVRWPEMRGLDVPWSDVVCIMRNGRMLVFQLRSASHALPGMGNLGRMLNLDPPHIACLTTAPFDDEDTITALCEDMVRQAGGVAANDLHMRSKRPIVGTERTIDGVPIP